jgi:2,3-bisphosphoglycerate-dependent phosphoglycerate mutase
MTAGQLVLLRHGESVWNADDRFAGWVDVPLTAHGRDQARAAGALFTAAGLRPDLVLASELSRAIDTAELVGATVIHQTRQLNERHYGDWQGRRRRDVAATMATPTYTAIHRGWDARPPAGPGQPQGYAVRPGGDGPESLHDVQLRATPVLADVLGAVGDGATVLIVAHGNVLRVLISAVEWLSRAETERLEVAIAVPRLYSLCAGTFELRRLTAPGART